MTETQTVYGDPWRDKTNAIAEMEDDYQQWISAARDPTTPAQKLQEIVQALAPPYFPTRQQIQSRQFLESDRVSLGGRRVLEAIAAHPNAPPKLLIDLFDIAPNETARGLCRNPVAPFLLLEAPAFVMNLPQSGQLALLRQSDCPSIFIQQMANASQFSAKSEKLRKYLNARDGSVEEAARLHVAGAGELHESDAWQSAVRDYWKTVCANPDGNDADQAAELVEIGLAPPLAAVGWEMLPYAKQQKAQRPPRAADYPYLEAWFRYECAEGSRDEAAMLHLIGPDVQDRAAFARALRANGTPNDLVYVAQTEASSRGLIAQAIIRHPNADARVLQALAARASGVSPRELLRHEKATTELVASLMSHQDISVRRLARQHKSAPDDGGETARRAFADRAFPPAETQSGQSRATGYLSPFASFVASLNFPTRAQSARLLNRAESLRWTERMEAVFIASANPDLLRADDAGRTCADLIDHLSQDGNRLVRAAARAYIAEPAAQFVL